MSKPAVLGIALLCLLGGAAYAQETPEEDNECTRQLTAAEEKVHDKVDANALSEADAEKVYFMLDEADALCTEGKFDEANATLANINKMLGN
jgi:soluble cytochrome b562